MLELLQPRLVPPAILALCGIGWSSLVSAADSVSLVLTRPAALEMKAQMATVTAPDVLETLGISDVADAQVAIPVPMRDGVHLAASILRLRTLATKRLPVILIRTPYKTADELSAPLAARVVPDLIRHGYAIVLVNDRGTEWSEGTYHFLKGANRDGYDILEWIIKQPWSNGKVGTYGCSSSAESQLGLSTLNHPAHKAVVEIAGATAVGSVAGDRDPGMYYMGGIPSLTWAYWYRSFGHWFHPQLPPGMALAERARVASSYSPEPVYGMGDIQTLVDHLPSEDILRAVNTPSSEWDEIIQRAPSSAQWLDYDLIRDDDKTAVPALHVGSWYDPEAYATTKLFSHFQSNSPNQYFLMGGTAHCMQGSETVDTSVGGTTIGDARFDYANLIEQWFDQWLKTDGPAFTAPRVQYYVLNSNHWEHAGQWPPPEAQYVTWYLQSAGHANSRLGDGILSANSPAMRQSSDEFIYDPLQPAPAVTDFCCNNVSQDQSPVEMRQDVLVYTTPPFAHAVRLVGDVNVTLAVSSSVPDTDIIVRLVDVHPDGRAFNLTESGQRLRYRDGLRVVSSPMQPGRIYRTTIVGMTTATELAPGHRLRLQITSSDFPNYERNLNSGGRNFDETQATIARTRIHHEAGNVSSITYAVLPAR